MKLILKWTAVVCLVCTVLFEAFPILFNLVRIFIHAPKEYRVKKVMEMYGDSQQEGEKSIARSDAARGAYYKNVSGRDWGEPHQYELCVDSSVGSERAADLITKYIIG